MKITIVIEDEKKESITPNYQISAMDANSFSEALKTSLQHPESEE